MTLTPTRLSGIYAVTAAGALTLALAAAPAAAATISCTFSPTGLGGSCDAEDDNDFGTVFFGNAARYAFDPDGGGPDYFLDIIFDDVIDEFELEIENVHRTPEEMAAKFAANFPGYVCVPIFAGSCVEFIMTPVLDDEEVGWAQEGPRGPGAIQGYTMTISWFAATDPPFNDPSILKYDGSSPDGSYDRNITVPGSYFNGDPPPFPPGTCEICIEFAKSGDDPGIGGRDIAFSVNTVAQQVPEPATLALMGLGLGAVAYVSRRRRRPVSR